MSGNLHLELARQASRLLFTVFNLDCRVKGRENLPGPETAYILAMNHASLLDPALIWAFHPHPVYFLAKEEFHRMPILGTASARVGNIGVRRGQFDRPALERSIDYLTVLGRVLGIFVEGARTADGELQEPRSGPALLALMTGAPVVPAYLHGTYELLPRRAVVPRWRPDLQLVLGRPLQYPRAAELPPREQLRSVADEVGQALAALRRETVAA